MRQRIDAGADSNVLLACQDYSPLKHTIKRAIRTSQLSWLFGVLFWDICGWRVRVCSATGKRPHLHPAKNATSLLVRTSTQFRIPPGSSVYILMPKAATS